MDDYHDGMKFGGMSLDDGGLEDTPASELEFLFFPGPIFAKR